METFGSACQKLVIQGLVWYQKWISPLYPPCCRFTPSCSQYAIDALKTHGVLKGAWLTFRRLLKCTPLHPGGEDPIPSQHNRYKN